MSNAARVRRRLVNELRRDGVLSDPHWARAFRQVPRHEFLPRYFVPRGTRWAAVAEGDREWLPWIYSDSALVTQLDGDPGRWEYARRRGPVCGVPTCSSSMPSIMAVMLEDLRVTGGSRVLEIGTGTGYNAALLCHRLGDDAVTTVDVDPELLTSARAALAAVGHRPRCALTDGEHGCADAAPYDRVLCTCAVSRIPPAWLDQTRPGGLVVTALNRPIGAGLVRLVAGHGATGHGDVLPEDGRFMPMRAHRHADVSALPHRRAEPATRGTTRMPLSTVLDPRSPFEFFVSLEIPGLLPADDPADETVPGGSTDPGTDDGTDDGRDPGTGFGSGALLVHADGSWARLRPYPSAARTPGTATDRSPVWLVEQGGPRALWDLVERAHDRWRTLGCPSRSDFAVTVDGDEQHVTLGPHDWPLERDGRAG